MSRRVSLAHFGPGTAWVPPGVLSLYQDASGHHVDGRPEDDMLTLLGSSADIVQVAFADRVPIGVLVAREIKLNSPMALSIEGVEQPLREKLMRARPNCRFAWIDGVAVVRGIDEALVKRRLIERALAQAALLGVTHVIAAQSPRISWHDVEPLGFQPLWGCPTPVQIYMGVTDIH